MAQALKGSDAKSVLCGAIWTQKLGSKAHMQAIEQYAGEDKWAAIQDDKLDKLTTTKYKGTGKYSLSKYATFHKQAYASLQNCANYVNVTVPNERLLVTSFLDSIDASEPKMVTRLEFVHSNDSYLADFNRTVNYLMSACPVKSNSTRNNNNQTSNILALNLKSGTGKISVELCWYPLPEWKKLTDSQKDKCIK